MVTVDDGTGKPTTYNLDYSGADGPAATPQDGQPGDGQAVRRGPGHVRPARRPGSTAHDGPGRPAAERGLGASAAAGPVPADRDPVPAASRSYGRAASRAAEPRGHQRTGEPLGRRRVRSADGSARPRLVLRHVRTWRGGPRRLVLGGAGLGPYVGDAGHGPAARPTWPPRLSGDSGASAPASSTGGGMAGMPMMGGARRRGRRRPGPRRRPVAHHRRPVRRGRRHRSCAVARSARGASTMKGTR